MTTELPVDERQPPAADPTAASAGRMACETVSLAAVLGVSVGALILERHGLLGWQAYPSTLVLFLLGLIHWRLFRVPVHMLPSRPGGWLFPVLWTAGLVLVVVNSPAGPSDWKTVLSPSLVQFW